MMIKKTKIALKTAMLVFLCTFIAQSVLATDYVRVYTDIEILDINNAGTLVGATGMDINGRAAMWKNGQLIDLGLESYSMALLINNIEQVVVKRFSAPSQLYIWKDGQMKTLEIEGQNSAGNARDINDGGTVVGSCWVNHKEHAVIWQNNGQNIDIGAMYFADRDYSYATAINNKGEAVGCTLHKLGYNQWEYSSFIWKDGQVTMIEGMDKATDINNNGLVVGFANISNGLSGDAVAWQDGELTNLGIQTTNVTVNNRDQILINGRPATIYQNGETATVPNDTPDGSYGVHGNDVKRMNDCGQIILAGHTGSLMSITNKFYYTPVCNPDLNEDGEVTTDDSDIAFDIFMGQNLRDWMNTCFLPNYCE